jgi:hypothetical protein
MTTILTIWGVSFFEGLNHLNQMRVVGVARATAATELAEEIAAGQAKESK